MATRSTMTSGLTPNGLVRGRRDRSRTASTPALLALEPLVAGLAAHSEFTVERRQAVVGLQGLQHELFSDAHDGLFLPGHRRRSNVERALEKPSPVSWHRGVTYVLALQRARLRHHGDRSHRRVPVSGHREDRA